MCGTDRPNQRFKLYLYQNHLRNDVQSCVTEQLLSSGYSACIDGSEILLRTPISFGEKKSHQISVPKQIEHAAHETKFPRQKIIQCMQNKTITTKKALNYNKAGNEMWEGCLFCVYFDLGIFHYLIGMELCTGVCVHVPVYSWLCCHLRTGGKSQSPSWLYTTAVTLTQPLVLSS